MRFSDFALDARLQRAVTVAGYTAPTPIQEAAIPLGLEGHDLIGTAQTGTGKTAAFVLPVLQLLLTRPVTARRTRALVVTPTRELAEQIHASIRMLARHTGLRSAVVYGGVGMRPQEQALRQGIEVIVACPGRLLDHMDRGNADLSGVEALVLDEADRMLDMGFLPSVKRIVAKLPRERQTMLFSATFAPELEELAAKTLRSPVRVDMGTATPAKTVSHALYPVPQHLKTALLLKLLGETDAGSVLIFARTKHRADRVARQVRQAGYTAAIIHSNRSQNQRQQALDGFRQGKFPLLVATDIAARGLDVVRISRVINYDIPDTADTYIHRIGRTGRAERNGDALTLVSTEDSAVVRDIERTLGRPIEKKTVAGFDYSAPVPPHGGRSQPPQARRRTRPWNRTTA
ncbi:MAG: DEAD/DEAH box helicase [Firmicutes bacterium]|nr:DEAD/DEAH box helicase [Bacillota bacterium]